MVKTAPQAEAGMFDGWRADSCDDQSIGVESSGTSARLNWISPPLFSEDIRDVGVKSITAVPLAPGGVRRRARLG